jgi:hypothetical protein
LDQPCAYHILGLLHHQHCIDGRIVGLVDPRHGKANCKLLKSHSAVHRSKLITWGGVIWMEG